MDEELIIGFINMEVINDFNKKSFLVGVGFGLKLILMGLREKIENWK